MINSEMTTEAVRLALGINQLRAEYASRNIANSNLPGTHGLRPDFAQAQGLLEEVARANTGDHLRLAERLSVAEVSGDQALPTADSTQVQVDEEVADMVGASLAYQTLTQSLSRYFGLMRLAATGRS